MFRYFEQLLELDISYTLLFEGGGICFYLFRIFSIIFAVSMTGKVVKIARSFDHTFFLESDCIARRTSFSGRTEKHFGKLRKNLENFGTYVTYRLWIFIIIMMIKF